MRGLMIAIALVLLLLTSAAVGLLAADWPFWQRAWRWQEQSWPVTLPGARVALPGARPVAAIGIGEPLAEDAALLRAADTAARDSEALLVLRDQRLLLERYGPGVDAATPLASRELAEVLPALLYGIAQEANLVPELDAPVRGVLTEWGEDPRGAMTARQLLWSLSGLESPRFIPWNPLHRRARLGSGPDFARAALDFRGVYPPGSHFERSPANPQLIALIVERGTGVPFARYLQDRLWQPLGAGPASAMLDRSAGRMAVHCCVNAVARDWLRVGALLAGSGEVRGRRVLPARWLEEMSTTSPVHPGHGLALEVEQTATQGRLLHIAGTGRDLWVLPEKRLVVLHFRLDDREPDAALLAELRSM